MSFCILGRLAVIHDHRDFAPTAPKVRQALAFLLVRRNQIVPVGEFVDELWGDNPPDGAMTTLRTYIYKLRKDVLDPSGLARLHSQSSGYILEVADGDIDVYHFEQLSRRGRAAQQNGDPVRASALLTEALALWRGKALQGVTTGEILSANVTRLEEDKLQILGLRIETDLQLDRHEELISELMGLVSSYPLHERFHADLMTALHHSGRRFEALQVYRRLQEMLIAELGLEPSAAVQRLHQSLLRTEPTEAPARRRAAPTAPVTPAIPVARVAAIAASAGTGRTMPTTTTAPIAAAARATAAPVTVPAQLPPDIPEFTGRAQSLRLLRAVLEASRENATTAHAVLICGMPGVGKTTLGLRAAHLVKTHYPDGQLYADLQGSTMTPAPQLEVLGGFLRALGVPEHQIPVTAEERSSLFRSWSNGRRLLVLLDNASSTSQIAPLIQASASGSVIITSRWGLHDQPGVHVVKLDTMSMSEGVELLANLIGHHRVLPEREEAERIVDRCGNLPLALRCVGARLAAAPTWPLRKMAMLIESGPSPLDHLCFAEFDVRAAYDRTYFRLDPQDRSALRLLSLLPASHFTASTAAGLLGTASDASEVQLSRLVAQNLLEATSGEGGDVIHYQMHRLIQFYARERLNHEFVDPDTSRLPTRSPDDRHPKGMEVRSDSAAHTVVGWAPGPNLGFS